MTLATAADLAERVTRDPRWEKVRARDAAADGAFYYSVRTTGVYCRPSCGARLARPENVAFHATRASAEAAGFRPCKRCRPDGASAAERRAAIVAAIGAFLEASDETPTLEAIGAHVGLSPFHAQRVFREATGVTPKAYAAELRAKRVREALARRASVTEAMFDAGFGSSGRFYAGARATLGMTPREYRDGAPSLRVRFAVGECSLGAILVSATDRGVCAILLGDDPDALVHDLERRFPRADLVGGDAEFDALVATVVGLVEDPRASAALPLDVRGTAFQRRVFEALARIPPGTTTTYAALAASLGAPRSARAVARAIASNPLAVAIPCHRVVRTDGSLSGYRWGVERKRALLEREGATLPAREPARRGRTR